MTVGLIASLIPLLILLGLIAAVFPNVNVPVVSTIVCNLKGASWWDGGFGLPTGCYANDAFDFGTTEDTSADFDLGLESEPFVEPEPVQMVPDVLGYHEDEAGILLSEDWGLDSSTISVCDGFAFNGEVVDQNPTSDTPLEGYSQVMLYVNRSRAVPYVTDLRADEATRKLEAKGFGVAIQYVDDDFVDPGIVTDQESYGEKRCSKHVETIYVEISEGFEY